ncbi:hypothetical protein ATANTOWER_006275 [Ataeniobius toweri]|uniref:Uncharacterized protein n=1 Tax=Ataeniobius toweri TaxID=208326 RepID=A0ABU7A615_9TELE|nr:hypothetical protein [Ataeniobius toweri]
MSDLQEFLLFILNVCSFGGELFKRWDGEALCTLSEGEQDRPGQAQSSRSSGAERTVQLAGDAYLQSTAAELCLTARLSALMMLTYEARTCWNINHREQSQETPTLS